MKREGRLAHATDTIKRIGWPITQIEPKYALAAACGHESAHGLVAVSFGAEIGFLEVYENGDGWFYPRRRMPRKDLTEEQEIVVAFAGAAAEVECFRGATICSCPDIVEAWELVSYVQPDPNQQFNKLRELASWSQSIVRARWSEITQLAGALVERRHIRGAEVPGIVFGQDDRRGVFRNALLFGEVP